MLTGVRKGNVITLRNNDGGEYRIHILGPNDEIEDAKVYISEGGVAQEAFVDISVVDNKIRRASFRLRYCPISDSIPIIEHDCPVCSSEDTIPDSDFPNTMRNCNKCGAEWNYMEITLDPAKV